MALVLIVSSINLALGFLLGNYFARATSGAAAATERSNLANQIELLVMSGLDLWDSLRQRIRWRRETEPELRAESPAPAATPAEPRHLASAIASASPGPLESSAVDDCALEQELADSLQAFREELSQYREQLAGVEDRARTLDDDTSLPAWEGCAQEICDANQRYLQRQAQTVEMLRSGSRAADEAKFAELHRAFTQQTVQIERSHQRLTQLQQAQSPASYRGILDETMSLMNASFVVRDAAEQATLPGGARAKAQPALSPQFLELLESKLAAVSQGKQQFSMGLVDPDHLQVINRDQGVAVGDRILDAIEQIIRGNLRESDTLERYQGHRFLLLLDHVTAREATNVLERIRQQIQHTVFQRKQAPVPVTASCGVVQAAEDDHVESILQKSAETIAEAKRYGRNQTFFQEHDFPSPAIPPDLSFEPVFLSV